MTATQKSVVAEGGQAGRTRNGEVGWGQAGWVDKVGPAEQTKWDQDNEKARWDKVS